LPASSFDRPHPPKIKRAAMQHTVKFFRIENSVAFYLGVP
jgi:hypothetical protein